MKSSMYIYNIFPRLYRGIDDWIECVKRAKKMGFNTIFVNSFLKCGESNSIYSIADYYSYDDLSFNCKKQDYQNELKRFLNVCKQENMDVLFDLVINHTAIDNELTKSHKSWYKLDEDGNILNPSTPNNEKDNGIEVWKDCAKLDYSYRNYELWTYIVNVCKYYISLGFDGFRCDAATQVPARFWNFLISKLRKDYPSIIFIGETFMCTSEEKLLLAEVGFNYIFNSAKWWNYSEDWLIQQNEETRKYIPSISFPENHDTERLMNEVNGNIEKFKQRLWFTGLFSKGFMITSGFEYGYTKKTHVVYTRQKDKEQTKYDFTSDIAQILNLKSNHKALYEESSIKIVVNNKRYIAIIKEYDDDKVLMLINKTNTSFIINTKIDNILNSSEMLANSKGVIIELKPMEISIYSVLRKKMKAAVLVGKKHLEMQEVPIPLMDENEVTVKVVACGICGSDVHEYNNGPFFWEPTRIGGHEFIGIVDQIGKNVSQFKKGDKVVFRCGINCQKCEFCFKEKENLCVENKNSSIQKGGGFAQYAVVNKNCLVKPCVNNQFYDNVIIEPLAVAIHAIENNSINDKKVAIVGSGIIALLLEQVISYKYNSNLTLFYKHDNICDKCSLKTNTIYYKDYDENKYDVVFECTGKSDGFSMAYEKAKRGGKIVVLSMFDKDAVINLSDIMFNEKSINGSFLYNKRDIERSKIFISEHMTLPQKCITKIYQFDDINEAFSAKSGTYLKNVINIIEEEIT